MNISQVMQTEGVMKIKFICLSINAVCLCTLTSPENLSVYLPIEEKNLSHICSWLTIVTKLFVLPSKPFLFNKFWPFTSQMAREAWVQS